MKNVEKILIIKLRAVGDVVLSTIVLDNIRAAYPVSRIDFLTEDSCKEVVLANPILNNVLSYERKEMAKLSPWRRFFRNIKFLNMIRHQHYDLVFDFFGNPRSALITWWSRARIRVGYNYRFRTYAYTDVVPSRAHLVHESIWHLDALEAVGLPIDSRKLSFFVGEGSKNFADNFWQQDELDNQRVIAFNFSGGWPTKRWSLDRFAHLADCLYDAYHARILLIWGPGEKQTALTVQHLATRPTSLIPDTNLKQLAAILQKVDLLVTTDSGPMHIAAAMGTPCVALYGPTNSVLQGPFGDQHQIVKSNSADCLGCNRVNCDHISCMNSIAVRDVLDAVRKCLSANQLYEP
jgi:lipopolysaccharide heptosyltransferase II